MANGSQMRSVGIVILAWSVVASATAIAQEAGTRNVAIGVPPELRQAEGFDPAQSAGLFVGIHQFKDKKFLEVPFAVDDAVDLAHLFALELELIRPEKVVLSLAGEPQKAVSRQRLSELLAAKAVREPATKSDLLRLLDKQRRASGPRGLFVATFATHGFSDEGSDFLVAADSLRSFIKDTGVRLNVAFGVVAEADAPRRLVLLDACREKFRRGQRGLEGAAMSASFADAIAKAEGMAVISGTTLGGFAYDDSERKNGVFTAAVLDALRGGARGDDRGLITVQALADEVSAQVKAWVRDHRPEDLALSRGISLRVEGEVARMPLAVDADRLRSVTDFRRRRDVALQRLRAHLDAPLTGAMYDEMKAFLDVDVPSTERMALLAEIEALDGTERLRRALASYWREHRPAGLEVGDGSTHGGGDRRSPSLSPPTRPGPWTDPILGIDFVYIEPGTFWMGSPVGEEGRDEDERRHRVELTRGFWMATTEVTQAQFEEFVKDSVYQTDAEREGFSWAWNGKEWGKKEGASWRDSGGPTHPVAHVSWNDAEVFCQWLSRWTGQVIRLPSEAEWEYAARAGTDTATYAGELTIRGPCDAPQLEEIAWYCGNSEQKSHPVAKKKRNLWGLYDILGNLWEWTADAAEGNAEKTQVETDTYQDFVKDPTSARGPERVIRGGSWFSSARSCRAANRIADAPAYRNGYVGFRIVRTLP